MKFSSQTAAILLCYYLLSLLCLQILSASNFKLKLSLHCHIDVEKRSDCDCDCFVTGLGPVLLLCCSIGATTLSITTPGIKLGNVTTTTFSVITLRITFFNSYAECR